MTRHGSCCHLSPECAGARAQDGVSEHICQGVSMLVRGGAAFLAIASNTGHIAV
jgi:aspartate/glutamate racemase